MRSETFSERRGPGFLRLREVGFLDQLGPVARPPIWMP
jgi:hypothetical protein